MGVGGPRHAPTALPPERDTVPIVQEAGWAPGPVWTGVEYLAPIGIRSPDRPARSYSDLTIPVHLKLVNARIYQTMSRRPKIDQ
jgi:hypothetical protein